jgi:hypothetical protein
MQENAKKTLKLKSIKNIKAKNFKKGGAPCEVVSRLFSNSTPARSNS